MRSRTVLDATTALLLQFCECLKGTSTSNILYRNPNFRQLPAILERQLLTKCDNAWQKAWQICHEGREDLLSIHVFSIQIMCRNEYKSRTCVWGVESAGRFVLPIRYSHSIPSATLFSQKRKNNRSTMFEAYIRLLVMIVRLNCWCQRLWHTTCLPAQRRRTI